MCLIVAGSEVPIKGFGQKVTGRGNCSKGDCPPHSVDSLESEFRERVVLEILTVEAPRTSMNSEQLFQEFGGLVKLFCGSRAHLPTQTTPRLGGQIFFEGL